MVVLDRAVGEPEALCFRISRLEQMREEKEGRDRAAEAEAEAEAAEAAA